MLRFFDNKIISRTTQAVTLQANIDKDDDPFRARQNRVVAYLSA
jgi:hypothetical protein